jgi:hypothetical protein
VKVEWVVTLALVAVQLGRFRSQSTRKDRSTVANAGRRNVKTPRRKRESKGREEKKTLGVND